MNGNLGKTSLKKRAAFQTSRLWKMSFFLGFYIDMDML